MSEKRSVGPVTTATTVAAAAVTVLCWIIGLVGLDVPAEIQGALTTVIVGVAGYLVKPRDAGRYAA